MTHAANKCLSTGIASAATNDAEGEPPWRSELLFNSYAINAVCTLRLEKKQLMVKYSVSEFSDDGSWWPKADFTRHLRREPPTSSTTTACLTSPLPPTRGRFAGSLPHEVHLWECLLHYWWKIAIKPSLWLPQKENRWGIKVSKMFYVICMYTCIDIWEKCTRTQRRTVAGVPVRNRTGAPSRKRCVANNGQMAKTCNKTSTPAAWCFADYH